MNSGNQGLIATNPVESRSTHLAVVRTVIVPLSRSALGLIFVWSSLWKLYQPYEFLRDVYNYDLLGAGAGYIVAAVLPWLELILGLALVMNVLGRGASILSVLLLIVFLWGQVHALYAGLYIPCGCFSANGETISYRNVITTGTALLGAILVAGSELSSGTAARGATGLRPDRELSTSAV